MSTQKESDTFEKNIKNNNKTNKRKKNNNSTTDQVIDKNEENELKKEKVKRKVTMKNQINKQLIKIKRLIINDKTRFYITDDKHIVIRIISLSTSVSHMKSILKNTYSDVKEYVNIELNTLYDINDIQIIKTIKRYSNYLNYASNANKYEDVITNRNEDYKDLSLTAKVAYLFEANCTIGNMSGYYMRVPKYFYSSYSHDDIYLFTENINYKSDYYDNEDQKQLAKCFRRIGRIEESTDLLNFKFK